MNLATLVQQGGIFMVPLLLMSVLALSVIIERTLYFAMLEWGGAPLRSKLIQFVSGSQITEAQAWLQRLRGPIPAVALAGLRRWDKGRRALDNALVSEAHREQAQLQRFLPVLETTVTASPLIGLLGTITGMMGVFRAVADKMAKNPQADTSGILAGIGEALIATATGILVAVVCLFFHNLFQRLAEQQLEATQDVANVLVELYDESHPA